MTQLCTGNPEQKWCYDEPSPEGDVHKVFSEKEVVELYMPYWSDKMTNMGMEDYISDVECIDDWIVLHWAYKVEDYENMQRDNGNLLEPKGVFES